MSGGGFAITEQYLLFGGMVRSHKCQETFITLGRPAQAVLLVQVSPGISPTDLGDADGAEEAAGDDGTAQAATRADTAAASTRFRMDFPVKESVCQHSSTVADNPAQCACAMPLTHVTAVIPTASHAIWAAVCTAVSRFCNWGIRSASAT